MIQVVKRVFGILEVLREGGMLPLKEIAERVALKKTTCHNILKSLVESGMLDCPRPGCYRIGPALRRLAALPVSDSVLMARASVPIERLAEQTGETVILAVFRELAIRVLGAAEGVRAVVVRAGAHQQASLYRWATGRVLLAHQPDSVWASVRRQLGPPTEQEWPEVALAPDRLEDELRHIRTLTVLHRPSLAEEGVVSLACPIRDGDGCVAAALGISIPGFRAADTVGKARRELTRAAAAISRGLAEGQGHRHPACPAQPPHS